MSELWGVDTVAEWLEACLFMIAVITVAVFCLLYASLMTVLYICRFLLTGDLGFLSEDFRHGKQ